MPQKEDRYPAFHLALTETIRERREGLGLSLTRFGASAGLSQQAVSYLERRMRQPNVETLFRVAESLGMSISELVGEAELRCENGLVQSRRRKSSKTKRGRSLVE